MIQQSLFTIEQLIDLAQWAYDRGASESDDKVTLSTEFQRQFEEALRNRIATRPELKSNRTLMVANEEDFVAILEASPDIDWKAIREQFAEKHPEAMGNAADETKVDA